jgi:hypothetical protein
MLASRLVALSVLSLAFVSTAAWAEETAKPARKERVYTLDKIVIPGRVQRPHVMVDVNKVVQKAPLPELKKALVDPIGKAVESDPF